VTVTALVSGGKDSVYSAYLADTQGITVDELLVLAPSDPDSMLFHTPNLSLVALQARAWGKATRTVRVEGNTEAEEATGLRTALEGTKGPVVSGAIASSYQWSRLNAVTYALGRPLYTPLWGKPADRIVREEIAAGLDIRLVQLAAEPLTPELLGQRLDLGMLREIERRGREIRAVHIAGEGGEFETLVTDLPEWSHRLVLDRVMAESRGSSTRLVVHEAHLEPKRSASSPPQS
jgi:diphthine-ammonia ligase